MCGHCDGVGTEASWARQGCASLPTGARAWGEHTLAQPTRCLGKHGAQPCQPGCVHAGPSEPCRRLARRPVPLLKERRALLAAWRAEHGLHLSLVSARPAHMCAAALALPPARPHLFEAFFSLFCPSRPWPPPAPFSGCQACPWLTKASPCCEEEEVGEDRLTISGPN